MLLNRRVVLGMISSTALLPFVSLPVAAAEQGVDFIILSDLHSAYERMAQLLLAIQSRVSAAKRPQVILFNGDLFESGNVVATRSAARPTGLSSARLPSLPHRLQPRQSRARPR